MVLHLQSTIQTAKKKKFSYAIWDELVSPSPPCHCYEVLASFQGDNNQSKIQPQVMIYSRIKTSSTLRYFNSLTAPALFFRRDICVLPSLQVMFSIGQINSQLWARASLHSESLSFCLGGSLSLCLGGRWEEAAGSFGNGENSAAVCSISEWGRNNEIISTPINPNLTDAAWNNATERKKQNKARIKINFFCRKMEMAKQFNWY